MPMRPFMKFAIVVAGYVVAWLVASLVVAAHEVATAKAASGADGMFAFGDLLLWIAVFGAASLVPTVVAIRFLRSPRT